MVRMRLSMYGIRGIDVPQGAPRPVFLCGACRGRIVGIIEKIISQLEHGPLHIPHLDYRRWYDRAATEQKRDAIIHAAEDEYRQTTGRTEDAPKKRESLGDMELIKRRILDEGDGWAIQDVDQRIKCGRPLIRKVRIADGRDPEFGKKIVVEIPADKLEHARRLIAQGMTERQVEMATGLSKSSVRRAAGKAA